MQYKDYYKILDLQTTKVSIDEVKNAYRLAAKKYHPDVNVGNQLAEERIKDINEAYRILSTPSSKRKYDRIWNAHFMQKARIKTNGKETIINMFLGNIEKPIVDKTKAQKGENIDTEISIELQEAFFGTDKKITLKDIEGNSKTYNVNIPKGIKQGEKIRLLGQGKKGINGGKNGDLYIKINIKNNLDFCLEGYNLHTNLYLTPSEAALGTRVAVKTIDSETSVHIPQGVQCGQVIKIPSKGYPNDEGGRGELVAEVRIAVPKKLTSEEKELYEKLDKISKFNPRN